MKYFDIIPLSKISRNKPQFFTYSSKENLEIGTLLKISFGRKKIQGIVLKETTRPIFKIKPISKVVKSGFLTSKQIQLARQISTYYITSLGLVIKQFVPKTTKKETSCYLDLEKDDLEKEVSLKLTDEQESAIEKITKQNTNTPSLLFGPASAGKTEVIMKVMLDAIKKNKQCLLIIPEIFLSNQEIIRYKKRFPNENIIFFHSKLKASETTFALEKIKDGSAKIIISTRIGLFLPFKNLLVVAVDEEQDFSHKQWEQTPRYHARTVAEMITKIYKTKTIFVSSTPSLESINKARNNKYSLIELPRLKTTKFEIQKPEIIFPDLKKLYTKRTDVPLSEELKKSIKETLQKKKITLILVPRRGKSKLIYCTDCKKKLVCPSCNLPLIHEKNHYKCIHCSFKTSSPASCPNCRSFRLKDIGFGTEGVVESLQEEFSSAKIEFVDSSIFEKMSDQKKIFKKLKNSKIDILVGTYAIAKGFDIPEIELVATINADNWAGQTDFRFDERWLANLFQLSGRLNRARSSQKGKCIIQTYNPENELYEILQKQDWLKFADEEIDTRKTFLYPPFSFMIRLTLKQINRETLSKKVNKVYNELSRNLRRSKTSIQVPYFGTIQKTRNKWEKHILIKTTSFTSQTWRTISRVVPDEWIIDIDSESIF